MTIMIVATGNPGKLKEMQAYLAELDWDIRLKPEEIDVEETGSSFAENACLKASQVAKLTGHWAIADDSGLAVDALGGAPGIYSARYGNCNSDAERIVYLLKELNDHPNRQAQFVCVIAIAQPDGAIVLQAEGVCPGEIVDTPSGAGGFGYDPIFYVPDYKMTFADMPTDLKHQISHRGKAFQALIPKLKTLPSLSS